jgi:hypothetical protein
MDCTHDLATQLLDALAGRRFEILAKLIVLLSQKVAGDCHWESVIEGDSQFSI